MNREDVETLEILKSTESGPALVDPTLRSLPIETKVGFCIK